MDEERSSGSVSERDPAGGKLSRDTTVEDLRAYRAGDADALERLCQRYLIRMHAWVTGRLPPWARNGHETQDVVQDTFLAVVRRFPVFWPRSGGAFRAYMRKACRNKVREMKRDAARKPRQAPLDEDITDPAPSPLECAVGKERLLRYEAAFQRLGRTDRELIHLRFEMDFSYREIAGLTGKPSEDAARMAVTRALKKLVKEMGRVQ